MPAPEDPPEPTDRAARASLDDDAVSVFRSMRAFHDVHMTLSDWGLIATIGAMFKIAGVRVERLNLQSAQNMQWIMSCRVEGVKPTELETLMEDIRALPGVLSARVEHLLLRNDREAAAIANRPERAP